MERKIVAIIGVDDEIAFEKIDDSPVSYLEKEFGWLEQSGIFLKDCFIADDDETDIYQRYKNYLIEWVERYADDERMNSPLSFEMWKHRPEILVNSNIFNAMIDDLGNGEPTENGERTSSYFDFAKSDNGYCKVCLIERKTREDGYYELHIVNDIRMSDCKLFATNGKSKAELSRLVFNVLQMIKEMQI